MGKKCFRFGNYKLLYLFIVLCFVETLLFTLKLLKWILANNASFFTPVLQEGSQRTRAGLCKKFKAVLQRYSKRFRCSTKTLPSRSWCTARFLPLRVCSSGAQADPSGQLSTEKTGMYRYGELCYRKPDLQDYTFSMKL